MFVTQVNANTYRILNNLTTVLNYTICNFIAEGEYEEVDSGSLAGGGSITYDYQVPNDGVYIFKFEYLESNTIGVPILTSEETFINYHNIRNCVIKVINNYVCDDSEDCESSQEKDSKKRYFINAISSTFYTFMSIINQLYVDNVLYTILDPNPTIEIIQANNLIQKLSQYCECIGLLDTDGSSDCDCCC